MNGTDDIEEKYDRIGRDYNETRCADPFIIEQLSQRLDLIPQQCCVDIGCGTGNYTIALRELGLNMVGLDPSQLMLRSASAKCATVRWIRGTAEKMPLATGIIDGAIAVLTIHHWSDLDLAFRECGRVLRPGANLVVFTSTPCQMRRYWLNEYFPQMLARSIHQMPTMERVRRYLQKTGFNDIQEDAYFVHDGLADLFLYAGKHRPDIYFDGRVRKGISSFSDLANGAEVDAGLARLGSDLRNDMFRIVQQRYASDGGDYMFLSATKKSRRFSR